MSKQFTPSKVARSWLNFINKFEKNSLAKKETTNPEEILYIFRMIFILMNENFDHIQPNKYKEYLITEIFPKHKINSMSKIKNKIKKIFLI